MNQPTSFRRLFVSYGRIMVEVGQREVYWLPGDYDARALFKRIKAAGTVDLTRWQRER